MRVAFISGCIEYSICLANALRRRCEIDFYYSGSYARERDASILTLLDPAIGTYEINPYRLRDPRNIASHRRVAKQFNDYDVIHLQGSNFWFSLNRHACGKIPIVCTIHDPVQHIGIPITNRLFQALAQKISISQSSAFIVHGDKLKATLAALHHIPERRIFVIPHGEFSFYQRLSREACETTKPFRFGKRLLFFGEVRKNKGLEYLIRAEPLISALFDDYSIYVAGRFNNEPGNNLDYYRALMRNPDRFEIANRFIGNHEVAGIFEQSDIVVLPYVSASQSGVLAIAFGFGKPVVATNTGSIGEILEDGRTGLIVPPANERALADALVQLLQDEEQCARFGRNALVIAKEQLGWESIAGKTVQVYERARERKRDND